MCFHDNIFSGIQYIPGGVCVYQCSLCFVVIDVRSYVESVYMSRFYVHVHIHMAMYLSVFVV